MARVRQGRLPLAEAVRKCTLAAAERAGLGGRGVLRPGAAADIVVFDPARIADRATFTAPQQYPDGIRAVVVGGRPVVEDGAHGGARPGEILRIPLIGDEAPMARTTGGRTATRRANVDDDRPAAAVYHANALARGLALLERLAEKGGTLTLNDFHTATGLPKSTLVRLLAVLEEMATSSALTSARPTGSATRR